MGAFALPTELKPAAGTARHRIASWRNPKPKPSLQIGVFELALMGKLPGTVILRLGMRVLLLPFGGFGVPMEKVARLGAASLSTIIERT